MKKIVLISGGARSGKSSYALSAGLNFNGVRYFIATAQVIDDEMKERIDKHKSEREDKFTTIEEPLNLDDILVNKKFNSEDLVIIDCLAVWLGNLFHHFNSDKVRIESKLKKFIENLKQVNYTLLIVTNEVGMGIVPITSETRLYRDFLGILNGKIVALCDEFYVCFSGIPMKLKG